MENLEIQRTVRLTEDGNRMLYKLMELYDWNNVSEVIRVAIVKLYNERVDLNGRRKNKDM